MIDYKVTLFDLTTILQGVGLIAAKAAAKGGQKRLLEPIMKVEVLRKSTWETLSETSIAVVANWYGSTCARVVNAMVNWPPCLFARAKAFTMQFDHYEQRHTLRTKFGRN